MATHSIKKQPKSTVEINVKVPWSEIQKAYTEAFDHLLTEFEFQGFRKGKVPRDIAEKNLPKDNVYGQLIRKLMPTLYEEIVKKEDLKPIMNPKLELVKAKENEEWEMKITLAEKPEVKLKDYKKKVQEAKKAAAEPEIWVPGKDEKKSEPSADQKKEKTLNMSLEAVLKEAECEIPPLLVEEELERRLAQIVDDVQKIGLTVDKYLQSRNTSMDQLKERLTREITDTYRLEFILQAIADSEKLEVTEADLGLLFGNIKDEKAKKEAQANAYFYASVLRKQKALDFIIGL